MRKVARPRRLKNPSLWLFLFVVSFSSAWLTTTLQGRAMAHHQGVRLLNPNLLCRMPHPSMATTSEEQEFDTLLAQAKLNQAANFFGSHPNIDLTQNRWNQIFETIEESTENSEHYSTQRKKISRMEMAKMYNNLKDQGHLNLFGAITMENMPASGSHLVQPSIMEKLTHLSTKALTSMKTEPSSLLEHPIVKILVLEALVCTAFGFDLMLLLSLTLSAALADNLLLKGAILGAVFGLLSTGTKPKVVRHEAGHFLCAYLLGCPVEGYVLSTWEALHDDRFKSKAVKAGTSFFDPNMSAQTICCSQNAMENAGVERYSIILMAGIAAESLSYGQSDGGFADETALISFLSKFGKWDDATIRNQFRWGALQATLVLQEYKECYDALVAVLERGGSLGECIYAIEKAGCENVKCPLEHPLGFIWERPDGSEEWVPAAPT